MKSYNKITAVIFWMAAVIFIGTNLYLQKAGQIASGRMYRVEVSRLAKEIKRNRYENIDLSGCQYVYHVERAAASAGSRVSEIRQEFFEKTDSDYCVRQIDGVLYRFDYTVQDASGRRHTAAAVNLALAAMGILLAFVVFYIRQKIIKPFEALKEIPHELAKGRLAVPLPENKNRFFGRFVWGIDLLREYMETQQKRELKLQRAQKTLVLSVSHDIKTPLSAIKLYAKVISKGLYTDTEQLNGVAGSIDAKADEIGEFVAQMIKASGEDFLSLEVAEDGFYLSQLAEKIKAYYEDKLKLLHTEFLAGSYEDCMLRGDFDRSVEVLQNMMENAVKYGDGREVALTFSEEEGCVLVTVRNSGNTLPQTELLHIFDSFWRGSNAEGSAGSGLGLYICRCLMHRMGGDIFAQVQGGDMCVTAVFPMQ